MEGIKPEILNRLLDNERDWREHILNELSIVRKDLKSVQKSVAHLKAKAALIGGLSGAIVTGITSFLLQKFIY